MRLLVANFDKQSIVSRDEVIATVRRLPKRHYSSLNVIRYDPRRLIASTMMHLFEDRSPTQSKGIYYQDQSISVIVLFEFQDIRSFERVLFHEIGHFVFMRVLRQSDRDEWFYKIRPSEAGSVTAYGNRNAKEDFAECYAAWCHESPALPRKPLRFQFLREKVFPIPT